MSQPQHLMANPNGDMQNDPSLRRHTAFLHLLRLPLILVIGFAVYYFFIQGYALHVRPDLTITGDCNAGSISFVGNTTADTVYLKAGLPTVEAGGNYDQAHNTLDLTGNLCSFTISVPMHTNVHITGNDAPITLTGVTGKIELDDNAGNIKLNNDVLLAGSTVSNNAGAITITTSILPLGVKIDSNGSPIHITSSTIDGMNLTDGDVLIEKSMLTGQIQTSGVGTAQLQDVTLSNATIAPGGRLTITDGIVRGSVKVNADGAPVAFAGTLIVDSSLIIGNNGQDMITLPPALAFHLDASGISTFNSNYPALQRLNPDTLASTVGIHVDIGAHPQATLSVQGNGDALTIDTAMP
jgi:hypothetical protein